MDAQTEIDRLELLGIDGQIDDTLKVMLAYGKSIPAWDWLTSIKGLGAGGLASQLLAQIDDIGQFDTVSKLWRFAGWAVIDGEVDRCKRGEKSP